VGTKAGYAEGERLDVLATLIIPMKVTPTVDPPDPIAAIKFR